MSAFTRDRNGVDQDPTGKASLHHLAPSELLPCNEADVREMLQVYLLNQVIGELGHELNQRPGRLWIPLRAILHLLDEPIPPTTVQSDGDSASSSGPKGAPSPAASSG